MGDISHVLGVEIMPSFNRAKHRFDDNDAWQASPALADAGIDLTRMELAYVACR